MEDSKCFICGDSLQGQVTTVKEKGILTFMDSSKKRKDGKHILLKDETSVTVHEKCRKIYNKQSYIDAALAEQSSRPSASRRSNQPLFDFKGHCLFCGKDASDQFIERQKKLNQSRREKVHEVTKLDFKQKVIDAAKTTRKSDEWSNAVVFRIENEIDLIAAEGRYHGSCLGEYVMSLSTGVIGDENVNCHLSDQIGSSSLESIIGSNFGQVKFSRKKRVLPMRGFTSSVKLHDEVVPVDLYTIFRRISFHKKTEYELKNYFTYELAPYPPSLFDEQGMMRKSRKSVFYDLFNPVETPSNIGSALYVIDGGFLLHRVPWELRERFSSILNKYVEYVKKYFGSRSIIVFDGYPDDPGEKSTKSAERLRRNKFMAANVKFDESLLLTISKDKFLSNEGNKKRMISMLIKKFSEENISVEQAAEDADITIVRRAMENATHSECVVVVGEDIDLLVTTVKEKGILTFMDSSKKRKDGKHILLKDETSVTVHEKCRKIYNKQSYIDAALAEQSSRPSASRRSNQPLFDFKGHCLFCGKDASDQFIERQKKLNQSRREKVHEVTKLDFKQKVIDAAKTTRKSDEWSNAVVFRIENEIDLIAAEGRYHGSCLKTPSNIGSALYVIDGGFLLHRVPWELRERFSSILNKYVEYVKKYFGSRSIIVFDGYPDDPGEKSTKSAERLRRNKFMAANVKFDESLLLTISKDKFLSNEGNKKRMISMLIKKFSEENISVEQAAEDADITIVRRAMENATHSECVVVVGEDIDLLVIITALAPNSDSLFLMKPGKGNNATADEIGAAGEQVIAALYAGSLLRSSSLNEIRFKLFTKSLVQNNFNLATLPATEEAARLHSMRAFLQVNLWNGHDMDPVQWGWKITKHGLLPVPSTAEQAPQELLNNTACKCSKGCRNACGCRKQGMKCSPICYNCRGASCSNTPDEIIDDTNLMDDEVKLSDNDDELDELPDDEDLKVDQLIQSASTSKRSKFN
ncbi:unnamed protein product [Ceutorhynchus assimilis]|uniref:Tesmin/TSO1-like CXC domain-containing protein n=1 Tax=Ceutorhynchus assimilis TaxID=467358 RepID=A0A9N9MTM3_9CUCU|nr:unnamed protein product [Ceutorhynchus assimilis]